MFNEKSIHKKASVLKSVEALKEKESINRQMLLNLKIDLFFGILLKISIYIFSTCQLRHSDIHTFFFFIVTLRK